MTAADTLAASHLSTTSRLTGCAAENAAIRKEAKYQDLTREFIFTPIALETLGPVSSQATTFLAELGKRITSVTGDPRESAFLFQRVSIVLQRFNYICFKASFISCDVDE